MAIEYVYFVKSVNFNIGIKFHPRDNEGIVLSNKDPYINIEKDKVKAFLQANKYFLENGMLKETIEPVFDFVTDNTLDDAEISKMVKNMFLLKKKLPNITSETTLIKILMEARKQKRAKSLLTLIEERIELVNPTLLQQGVEWENDPGGE